MATIKGYLPVRVVLPSDEETFFYIKEHSSRESTKDPTLFVTNAPVVPGIAGKLLLQSLMGRYGEITRITLIENPRTQQQSTSESTVPSFLPHLPPQGKFAHVIFASSKELQKCLQRLSKVMKSETPYLSLESLEIQTLTDETKRQMETDEEETSTVLKLAQRYRQSIVPREQLLEECNQIMEDYEEAEERERLAREAAANEPDEDGFVTVRHTTTPKHELEGEPTGGRKKKQRRRNKKESIGASELSDFYRFQTKEKRKQSLQELRQRFEEDLAKVKKMKEEKLYRPF